MYPDCNDCKNISITEYDQDKLDKSVDHICNHYNRRCFHGCHSPKEYHDFIHPCGECKRDDFTFFDRRTHNF
jgi:hypothetical protein